MTDMPLFILGVITGGFIGFIIWIISHETSSARINNLEDKINYYKIYLKEALKKLEK